MSTKTPIKLYSNNKAIMNIVHNPIYHEKTKYVTVNKHFIIENIKN